MEGLRIKGNSFRIVLGAVETLRGREQRDRTVSRLQGEVAEAVRTGSILASGWYDVEWYRALIHAAVVEERQPAQLARALGHESARSDITTLHRAIFRLLSPETSLRQITRLLRLYYRGGSGEALVAEPGHARVRYSGFEGFDQLLWQDFVGGTEAVLEATGARGGVIKIVAGGGDGDATMTADATWLV